MKLSVSEKRLRGYNRCTPEEHLEFYSKFLRDGDYEFYMQFIDGFDKRELAIVQLNLVRALWIRNRFTQYSSQENNYYARIFNEEHNKLWSIVLAATN